VFNYGVLLIFDPAAKRSHLWEWNEVFWSHDIKADVHKLFTVWIIWLWQTVVRKV